MLEDFPGDSIVKNLSSNEGDMGSSPGQGTEIPHAMKQLCAATTEPACSRTRASQMEKALTMRLRPNIAKREKKKKDKYIRTEGSKQERMEVQLNEEMQDRKSDEQRHWI